MYLGWLGRGTMYDVGVVLSLYASSVKLALKFKGLMICENWNRAISNFLPQKTRYTAYLNWLCHAGFQYFLCNVFCN